MDAVSRSPLRRFLATRDLEELAEAREELEAAHRDADDELALSTVIHEWDDVQAVANLLMYPQLVPSADRHAAVLRGLTDDDQPYLRLAAAVGAGELDPAELDDETRHQLVRAMVDMIATDTGVLADRVSYSIRFLLRPADAPDVIECLVHSSEHVRNNLTQAMLSLIDSAGLVALLDKDGFVGPELQANARDQLAADGIDLAMPADEQRRPFMLVYVPSYLDWTP